MDLLVPSLQLENKFFYYFMIYSNLPTHLCNLSTPGGNHRISTAALCTHTFRLTMLLSFNPYPLCPFY